MGFLCLLWIFEKWNEKNNALDIFSKVFLIYLVVRLAALVFSEFPEVSVQILYKEILFYLCFFSFSFYLKALDVEKIKTIVYYFSFASAVIALIGIVRFNLSIVERAESFSSGYSTFSSYLLTGLGCMLALSENVKKIKYFQWLRIFAAAIILVGIITSLGRANSVIGTAMLIASLLTSEICEFSNVPNLEDTSLTLHLFEQIYANIKYSDGTFKVSVPKLTVT